jgi:hypothetical protein
VKLLLRALVVLLWLFSALCIAAAPAHAGPGGSLAMPGPCDYPGVGHQHYGAGIFLAYCDFPVEENCSHWHTESRGFNAGGPTGSGDYGFDFMGFGINIPGGIIGGGDGWQGYLYPDNTEAPWPNPPGSWKAHLVPRCPPEHNHPPAPVPPPPDAPTADPAPPPFTGAVTNPDNPNPDATQNPQ